MQRRHACRAQVNLQVQIEIGRVHSNKKMGWAGQKPSPQLTANGQEFGQMRQNLHITTNGQLLLRPPSLKALADHRGTANAGAVHMRPALPAGPQDRRT